MQCALRSIPVDDAEAGSRGFFNSRLEIRGSDEESEDNDVRNVPQTVLFLTKVPPFAS